MNRKSAHFINKNRLNLEEKSTNELRELFAYVGQQIQ